MVYVGEKSGASYVSGLSKIEEIYKVNVDAEFSKDECSTLLDRIKHDKKRTDLEPKERKKRSDWASHLKRYIAFRTEITRIVPSVQNCSSRHAVPGALRRLCDGGILYGQGGRRPYRL